MTHCTVIGFESLQDPQDPRLSEQASERGVRVSNPLSFSRGQKGETFRVHATDCPNPFFNEVSSFFSKTADALQVTLVRPEEIRSRGGGMFKEEFSTFYRVLHGWGGGLDSFFSPVLMSDLWEQPTCAPPPLSPVWPPIFCEESSKKGRK